MNIKSLSKRIILLNIVLVLSNLVFSQENYQSGFVLLPSADTIFGYIDYRDLEQNPNKISFKKDLNDNITVYTPKSCKGFGVLNERFESGIIQTETSPTKTDQMDDNPYLKLRTDTTFLQTIIMGEKSLYYYKNNLGIENFYIKDDSAYQLLIYKKYIKNESRGSVIAENKNYIGQLLIYLNDCPKIKPEIETLNYSMKDMRHLFLDYYDSKQATIQYEKKLEKVTTEFGVLAGCSFSPETNQSSTDYVYHRDMSLNMSFGVSLNFIYPRFQKKWSFYNEIVYAPYNNNFHSEEYDSENEYTITDSESKRVMIKMNNNIRYKYPFKKVSAYAYFGICSGFGSIHQTYEKKETVFHSISTVEEDFDSGNLLNFEAGLNLGLGFSYQKFSFAVGLDSFSRYNFLFGFIL